MIQTQISLTGILYLAYLLETNIFQNHSLFFDFINSIIEHELSAYVVHLQGLWAVMRRNGWAQPGHYAHYIT